MQLWVPSSETGRYTTQDCATLFLNQEATTLSADADRFVEGTLTIELTRSGDRVTGSAQGLLCNYLQDFPGLPDPDIATAGAGGSGNDCRYPVSVTFDVPVESVGSECGCADGAGDDGFCELGICSGETCGVARCPRSAAVCAGP